MTFQEKQQEMLADLLRERDEARKVPCPWWLMRLEEKITDLQATMGAKNEPA